MTPTIHRSRARLQWKEGVRCYPFLPQEGALLVAKSTIRDTIKNSTPRPLQKDRPRSGRPRFLVVRADREFLRPVRIKPEIHYSDLKKELGVEISRHTLRRHLEDHGITNWLAAKRPLLQKIHARQRLNWCKARRHWRGAEWASIVWSDECSIELDLGKKREWVFRHVGQKWDSEMIEPFMKGKAKSAMMWAAFCCTERGDSVRMVRDPEAKANGYTAASYLDVLEDQIPTIYQPGIWFTQDNARIHTARVIREWFTLLARPKSH